MAAESPKGNIEAIYPLTPVQDGILFETLLRPDAALYIQQYTCVIDGDLDTERFQAAWDTVIARHCVMRTLLTWQGRSQPLQVVRGTVTAPWTVADWADDPEQATTLKRFLEDDRATGFDLESAPLMRFALLRIDTNRHQFVWSHHHVILDGWSLGLVLDEVYAAYDSTTADPAPATTFRDFVTWHKQRNTESETDFWGSQLAGFTHATALIGDAVPVVDDTEVHNTIHHQLSEQQTTHITTAARKHGVTLSTMLRAAWVIILSRYSQRDDVVFGATVAGRPADLDGSLDMVGLFINSLPIAVRFGDVTTVKDLLTAINLQQLEMSEYESSSLVDIQRTSGISPGQPLFESLLVMENVPQAAGAGSLTASDHRYLQRSNYPLAILVMPGTELELIAIHDTQQFAAPLIERLLGHVANVLEGLASDPPQPIANIALLDPAEIEAVLATSTGPPAPPPEHSTIHGWIAQQTAATPDAVAVAAAEASLTYAELDHRATIVARQLVAAGVAPGDRVAINIERSAASVVGILGALKAGVAYVPLDPGLPEERIAFVLDDIAAAATIVGEANTADGAITLAPDGRLIGDSPDESIALPDVDADDVAYVLYTSGSTGRPKGVVVTHANLVSSTHARLSAYMRPVETFLLLSPFIFDSSIAGLFSTLTQGGTLVLPAPRMEQDVAHLGHLIAENRVTHTLLLPSLYSLLLELIDPERLASLQLVMVAGEPCPPSLVALHHATLPQTLLVNEYGPTEATVWCTVGELTPEHGTTHPVTIGRPIANTEITIMDQAGRLLPIGVSGELCVAGPGVAVGYLNRPERTAESFVERDIPGRGVVRMYRTGDLARFLDNGEIELLGRTDLQIKIRGQRIEPGEVERVLEAHPAVSQAVVGLWEPQDRPAVLVAHVATTGDPAAIAAFAADRLPNAMVPAHIVPLAAIPLGATGKIDRSALPDPTAAAVEPVHVPPEGEMQRTLADIWMTVLGVDSVSATDNFFSIGGDSLLSIRIIARAHKAGITITPRAFFDHPTIAGLAAVVT